MSAPAQKKKADQEEPVDVAGASPAELSAIAVWNEQDGGDTARSANAAIEELVRRAALADRPELEILDEPLPKLIAALAAAQGEFPAIEKTKTATVEGKNGKQGYSYAYADLGDVLAKVRPVLSKHGLALVQRTERVEPNGKVLLVTELHHTAGGVIESVVELGQSSSSPQQFGGALTYLRRYEAVTLLGIAAEEDRDAQDVDPAPRGAAAAVAEIPDWATSLTKERGPLVLTQLERVMPHDTARGILVNVYERTGGLPAIFLPFCKAIADALNGDPTAAREEQDAAAEGAVAAADQVRAPEPGGESPEPDVPADTEGLGSPTEPIDDDTIFEIAKPEFAQDTEGETNE